MSKKYEAIAPQIIQYVGGKENIESLRHCQTRLRFQLKDDGKADKEALEALPGVAKALLSGGMYQVVIGMDVADCYEEVARLLDTGADSVATAAGAENDAGKKQKKNPLNVVIDFVSGSFQPIIPALSGAGMLKALLAILVAFHWTTTDSQTYVIINFFADATFCFLPILIAYTEAVNLKCSPILAMAVAGIFCHPTWTSLVSAGDPVSLFGVIPFTLVTYTNTVIPIVLIILVQSYVEKFFNKVIPNAVKLVFVPMLTFLVMGTLGLAVLGPIGDIVGQGLGVVFDFLATTASWAPSLLVGGLLPVMVMFGLHHGIAPLGTMQMAELGYDSIFGPGCVCSNIAQGTANLVVAWRTKNPKERPLAISNGITALMGITEPALYGINLPKKYPLVASMIGGACGGLYAGLTHTHRFATGSSGLPAVMLYLGEDTLTYFFNIIIALVITAVVTAVATFLLSLKYEKAGADEQKEASHA